MSMKEAYEQKLQAQLDEAVIESGDKDRTQWPLTLTKFDSTKEMTNEI